MSRQNSITLQDFSNFLDCGAFIRYRDEFYLLSGPFKINENENSHDISVCYADFFEFEKSHIQAGSSAFCLNGAQLYQFCRDYLNQNTASKDLTKVTWTAQTREDFNIAFTRIQNLISQGQIEKAVPTTSLSADLRISNAEKAQMIINLMSAPDSLYVYGYWTADYGVIGATPEILFICQNKKIKTMALAGTLPKQSGNQGSSLLRDTKEIHEHKVVVEDIVQQFHHLGMVTTKGPELLELPALWHLKTDIQVELNEEIDFKKLVQRLHPTPALGVAPRQFGWRWMQELPGQNQRGCHGAPLSFLIGDALQISLVAIRNLQWKNDRAKIYVGCGVVKESNVDKEWIELDKKAQSVLSLLGFKI